MSNARFRVHKSNVFDGACKEFGLFFLPDSFLSYSQDSTVMDYFQVDQDISMAKTLNTDFYTSRDMFEASKEKLFSRSWQFVGSTELVEEPGSIYPFILLEDY